MAVEGEMAEGGMVEETVVVKVETVVWWEGEKVAA